MQNDKTVQNDNRAVVKKVEYVSPEIKCLGRLSTLIQGGSGHNSDDFPAETDTKL